MRLALTVVSPATRRWADVLLDADPAMLVAELGAELERLAYGTAPAGGGGAHAPQTVSGAGGPSAGGQVLRFPGPRAQGSVATAGPAGYVTLPRIPSAPAPPIPLYVDFQQVPPQLTVARLADQGRVGGQPGRPVRLPAARADRPGRDPRGRRSGRRRGAPDQPGRGRHRQRGDSQHPDRRPDDAAAGAAHPGAAGRQRPGRSVPGRSRDAGPGAADRDHAVAAGPADRRRQHAARHRPVRGAGRGPAPLAGRDGHRLQPAAPAAAAEPPDPVRAADPAGQAGPAAAAHLDGGRADPARRGHVVPDQGGLHAGHVRDEPRHGGRQLRLRPQAGPGDERPAGGRVRRAQGPHRGGRPAGACGRAPAEAGRLPGPRCRAVDCLGSPPPAVGAPPHRSRLPAAASGQCGHAIRGRADRPDARRAPQAGRVGDPGRAGDHTAAAARSGRNRGPWRRAPGHRALACRSGRHPAQPQ